MKTLSPRIVCFSTAFFCLSLASHAMAKSPSPGFPGDEVDYCKIRADKALEQCQDMARKNFLADIRQCLKPPIGTFPTKPDATKPPVSDCINEARDFYDMQLDACASEYLMDVISCSQKPRTGAITLP